MLRKELPTNYFKNRDLLFQIMDWQEFDQSVEVKDEDAEDDQDIDYSFSVADTKSYKKKPYKKREFLKKQMIRGYGVTDEGHSICVNILDFQPYFYLSLPQELTIPKNFDLFINILKDTVGDWHSKGLVSAELVERKEFYGFTNNELFKYAKFTFHSSMAYNGFKTKLLKETFRISRLDKIYDLSKNLCETKVKSMLRFFHTQNIDPAGWMVIKKGNYERNIGICEDKFDLNNKHSRCQIEVNCVYDKIEKIEKNSIGKVLVASFDLECVSEDGSFPKASNPLDPVIQIGTTVYEFGNRECKLSYVATLGACDPIENAIVESFKSEKELILGWAKFIAKLDPDIMTGYNIWGFDWKYLYQRAESGNGGLIAPYVEQLFNILQRSSREKKVELTEQKLSSSALGDNFLYYIDIEGIVQIDLFKVMQRDYKLDSYKLDNVAKHFMKMQKEDLPYKQLFANYKRGTSKDIQEIAIYCIKDCDLVNRLMDDRQVLVSNIGMANVCVVPFSYLFLKGQGIKIFSLVAKITREEGFVVKDLNDDDIDKASYEGAIVFVPTPGVYFEPVVVMDYNSLYPSSMIAENISHDSIVGYREYRLKSQMVGFKKEESEVGEEESVNEVKEVKASRIKNMLKAGVKKFEEEEKKKATKKKRGNLQDDTDLVCNEKNCVLIKDTVVKKYDNLPEYNYIEITYDVFEGIGDDKRKIGYKTCRFAESKSGEKALLPRILRVLLKARKDTRKKMEYQNMKMRDGSIKVGIVTTSDKRAVVSEIDPKADPNDFYLFDPLSKDNDKNSPEEYNVFHTIDGNYKVKKCDILSVEDTYNQGEIDVLDGLQLAYKVVCNSLYGQVGASTSPICYKELAACTTATGRNMVIHARDTTMKHFVGAKLTYGDSVTGDTPVLLRDTNSNEIYVKSIADLNDQWESYEAFKPWDTTLQEKEQSTSNAEIWTAHGWAKINRVIRHKTVKKIYRVLTHTGCVDVTEDHSLLSPELEQVKPKDVTVGTELRHNFPDSFMEKDYGICEEEAYLWGFFMGDGSAGSYDTKYGVKYMWHLNNKDLDLLNKLVEYAKKVEKLDFKIMDTLKSSNVYKVTPVGNIRDIAKKYRKMFYNTDKYKIVPKEIMNSTLNIKEKFLEGLYAADGCRADTANIGCHRIDTKGKISAQTIYVLLRSMGYNVSINTRKDKMNIFRLNYTKGKIRKEENRIKKIDIINETNNDEYVYDIETTDGTFQAGIGQMIVKNTDSIFVNFTDHIKQKYPGRIFTEEELLEESIKVGQEAAKNVNKDVKAPQNIEYEKTFWPFVIFSKKRYFGNKYEKSIKKYKETSMGIVLKRRDNAPILKSIYKGIIDIILNKRDLAGSKLFFRESVKSLLEGNVDISQLVISKTIKADYANPTQIAHKVLADRMGERDEGNKPQSNDRIPYCYIDAHNWKCSMCKGKINDKNCKCNTCMKIFCFQHMGNHKSSCTPVCRFCKVTNKMLESDSYEKPQDWPEDKEYKLEKCLTCTAYYCPKCFPKHKMQKDKYGVINHNKCKKAIVPKLLQGDLIEHPQYIQEEKLKIDFMYYFEHQIMKPVYQIFELDMAHPESIVQDLIVAYNNKKNGSRSIADFFGKPTTIKKEAVKKKNEDSDDDNEIEILLPKSKSKKEGQHVGKEVSPIASFDVHDIKVNDELKKEIMKNIEITMKKKETLTIADGVPDVEDDREVGGCVDENAEDINLALEMFEDIEDLRRDINDID